MRRVSLDPRPLPDHTVRESRRAKHVHLRFSLRDGLEVVVPVGFDRSEIPHLLEEKARWIARAEGDIEAQRVLLDAQPRDRLPARIELLALGEVWTINTMPTNGRRMFFRESPGHGLTLSGPMDAARWRPALRRWLVARAKATLVPWVGREAERHRLRHGQVTIRWQKTRWGSCSQRSGGGVAASLSLNAGLLFLPPHLVRYVILHELCHTTRMDHSPAFWRKLEAIEPSARPLREELRAAWHFVPAWVEGALPPAPPSARPRAETSDPSESC
jgi:hypothetical protein